MGITEFIDGQRQQLEILRIEDPEVFQARASRRNRASSIAAEVMAKFLGDGTPHPQGAKAWEDLPGGIDGDGLQYTQSPLVAFRPDSNVALRAIQRVNYSPLLQRRRVLQTVTGYELVTEIESGLEIVYAELGTPDSKDGPIIYPLGQPSPDNHQGLDNEVIEACLAIAN